MDKYNKFSTKMRANKVNQMGTEDMLDFKILCSLIGNNFAMNNDTEKVMWGKIKV